MIKNYLILGLITILIGVFKLSAQEYKSGDADIDEVRIEVKNKKTTEENFRERQLMLYMWLGALQQQGANTYSLFDIDKRYYELEPKVKDPKAKGYQQALMKICRVIDEGFAQMEKIQKEARG